MVAFESQTVWMPWAIQLVGVATLFPDEEDVCC
jgi:hypothetical protein